MKGKNKLVLVLFAVMALVATSVGFALKGMANEVRFANAASIPGFTAKLDGDVIFSTERVYFAVDGDGDSSNDYLTRQNPVEYKGYNFNSIMTNNGIEYFGDYALTNTYDYSNKKVVNNGDFVMANDKATYSMNSGEDEVIVKEGIMITLGGYYYNNHKTAVGTNAQKWDGSGFIGLDENEETGAGMTFVSAVQATLNGNPITLPNSRDYNNASNEDFTWFIVPSAATEGHYKISFLYSMKDFAEPVRYEFEFYLLLNSSYDTEVLVGESESAIRYSTKPNMMNSVLKNNREYEFYSGTTLNYPTLTFDYSRYDLSFTHTRGDETVEVDFEYDGNALNLTYELYGKSEPGPSYVVDADIDNTSVTLMFVEQGKYEFDFDYVYNKVSKVIIPQEQVPFENIKLNIYGYQLKYSKAGFTSADMTHLDIYKNGTMFILLDGYTNADDEKTGDSLGVSYSLIDTKTYRTGTIVDNANEIKNSGSESAMIVGGNADSVDALITNGIIDGLDYQRTDRGVWLTLKDEYVLENSFYYHRATRIDADYITLKNADSQQYVNRKDFTKVTTFTMPGYYLVQVKYKIDVNASETYTQYFAFQITATTPMLELYKTELEVLAGNSDDLKDKIDDFYAREFTNQNVYANWKDTEIFESKVSGKIYYVNGKYASESTLKSVADGKFNSSVTIKNYNKNTIIKDSGSYLLVLEVEKSATKTYTYFTIDKDPITGLEVYEVAINSIDNRAVYSIKQDQNLNYVTRTGAGAIDTAFTLFWNTKDKATVNDDTKSGAGITGTYRFTPFVVKSSYLEDNTISIERGDDLIPN